MAKDVTPPVEVPAARPEKVLYFLPDYGISVEAASLEEAIKIAEKK